MPTRTEDGIDGQDGGGDGGEDGGIPADFETAQRRLLEAVGLDAQSRFVTLEDPPVRTHVLEAGLPAADAPLVFVHGTGAFGAFFAPLMAHLDDARMIAFDRPGYGLSDQFVYAEETIRRTVVDGLEGVIDELELDQVDLVGHSMGGHAAIRFALAHPDRVRRLILVGGVPAFPGTRPPLPLRLMTVPGLDRLLRWMGKSGEEGVLDIAEVFGEREAIQDHPAFVQAMAAHERDPRTSEAAFSESNALFSIRGWHPSVRIREVQLRTLQHPTTIVWGEHDPIGRPADVRESVDQIPNARFETVDAGHIPYLAHPERCAAVVRESSGADVTVE